MTLTKPTLVCTDAAGTRFAVVFDSRTGAPPGVGTADDADPDDALDLARLGYKKGATLVLPGARRTRPRDSSGGSSGAGFVSLSRADEAGVRVVPAGLRVLTRVGASLRARDGDGNEGGGGDGAEVGGGGGGGGRRPRGCESCGRTTRKGAEAEEGKAGLMRCTGCGEMEYCSKECQIKGWNEDGHKGECKVIKAIRAVWP
ncbi:hypothetical protein MYCTH_106609 [Thermothelomyces thermophilus ATCC 42464]|uniref:MYND-type domain-containing protein n=1 Tax=Thermothelomyces thermophilus (strain ATCC 42464 / BCRC 31852 / DSM 1799) TaxID=573729 RepID=G2Q8A8_THET4|nr:uncharacterized protein MYCTH_106609 [Thermothelomyces thermophilus ATCC 42464]AEO57011.1 hypothetical protein MYCTH_106609 [Thermothelomyces thermophilus ATCC 42464]